MVSAAGALDSEGVKGQEAMDMDSSKPTKKIPRNKFVIAYAVLASTISILFGYVGMGPVKWVLGAEIFPLRLRAKGASLGVAVNRGMSGVVSMTFLSISKAMTVPRRFYLFLAVSALFNLHILLCSGNERQDLGREWGIFPRETSGMFRQTATDNRTGIPVTAEAGGAVTVTGGAVTVTGGAVNVTGGVLNVTRVTVNARGGETGGAETTGATEGKVSSKGGTVKGGAVNVTAGAVTVTAGAVTVTAGAVNATGRAVNVTGGAVNVTGGAAGGAVRGGATTGWLVTGGALTGGAVTGGAVTGGAVERGAVEGGAGEAVSGGAGGAVTGGEVIGTVVIGGVLTGGALTGGAVTGGAVTVGAQ